MKVNEEKGSRRAQTHELAVSAQSDSWKDRQHHAPRRVGGFLFVLAALTACVLLAITQINRRLTDNNKLLLDQVSVTATPVRLTSAASGRVSELNVAEGARVKAGDVLATIEVLPASSSSGSLEITSPVDGIVQDITAPEGGTVASGSQFITLYDPSKLFFEAPLVFDKADDLRVGSTAKFDVPGLGDIEATVTGVRSDFNTSVDATGRRTAQIVLEPVDASALASVVPGLLADGYIRKGSAAADAPRAVLNPRF